MISDFLGQFHVSAPAASRISETFMWKWAFEHPYLYTLIEIGKPYIIVVVVVAGVGIVRRMFRKV